MSLITGPVTCVTSEEGRGRFAPRRHQDTENPLTLGARFVSVPRVSAVDCVLLLYGPTPPLWQSEQFTAVRSPMSTGCLNGWACICARCDVPSS